MTVLALYNQDQLDDETFVENFVAREQILKQIVAGLRHIATGGETEHQILIGMRGMGKTSMLRRVALAIGEDDLLSATFVPLRFREEQYNVISLDTLWRNCGEALAQWCEENGRDAMADAIDRAVESPAWRDADKAVAGLLAFCAQLGRRPCLLIDNLDLILDNLEKEGWALRNTLQRDNGPVVVGATVQFLRQTGDRDAAFYEFFHPLLLEPLTEAELMQCMRALADRRGDAGRPVRDVLAKAPERIRTLYALTGGNPRVLALIYRLLEQAETEKILDDLQALLDEVTPFYKARVEEFQAAQQRAIIDAVALHWDPITSRALSEATGVPVTTISSQLSKLRRSGFIQEVETSGASAGYQLSERFLNIWYLMRHGTRRAKQRLRWLTIFLSRLFSEDELSSMVARAEAGNWHADFCLSVREAYAEIKAGRLSVEEASVARVPLNVGTIGDRTNGSFNDDEAVAAAAAMNDRAFTLWEAGRKEEAAELWQQVVDRFENDERYEIQSIAIRATINWAISLGDLGYVKDEIDNYERVIIKFGESEEIDIQEQLIWAAWCKGIALDGLGLLEQSLAAFDESLNRYGSSDEPRFQEYIARTSLSRAVELGKLSRSSEAVAAYDFVIARFSSSTNELVQQLVARAIVNRAGQLCQAGDVDEGMLAFQAAINQFEGSDDPFIQEQLAWARWGAGNQLSELKRYDEAIRAFDVIISDFGTTNLPVIQEILARSIRSKAIQLGYLGRFDEEIRIYGEIVENFSRSNSQEIQTIVADVWFIKALTLGASEKPEESSAEFKSFIDNYDGSSVIVGMDIARAYSFYGMNLSILGRHEEALNAFETSIARFGSEYPARVVEVVDAWDGKASELQQLGRYDEALAHYDDTIRHFGKEEGIFALKAVATALLAKGNALDNLGRFVESIATFEELIARFSKDENDDLRSHGAEGFAAKAHLLINRYGHYREAEAIYREALAVRPDWTDSANLVWALIAQGRAPDAQTARDALQDVPPEGLALMDAGIELVSDNLGNAFAHLGTALGVDMVEGENAYFEDIIWLLRIGADRGHGERMLEWFEASGHDERYRPIYAALLAYERGERFLKDINPEVRGVAERLYEKMAAPRRYREQAGKDGRPAKQ